MVSRLFVFIFIILPQFTLANSFEENPKDYNCQISTSRNRTTKSLEYRPIKPQKRKSRDGKKLKRKYMGSTSYSGNISGLLFKFTFYQDDEIWLKVISLEGGSKLLFEDRFNYGESYSHDAKDFNIKCLTRLSYQVENTIGKATGSVKYGLISLVLFYGQELAFFILFGLFIFRFFLSFRYRKDNGPSDFSTGLALALAVLAIVYSIVSIFIGGARHMGSSGLMVFMFSFHVVMLAMVTYISLNSKRQALTAALMGLLVPILIYLSLFLVSHIGTWLMM